MNELLCLIHYSLHFVEIPANHLVCEMLSVNSDVKSSSKALQEGTVCELSHCELHKDNNDFATDMRLAR